jgi:formamidopyrimidine-DNA glycosylase
MPELPEVETLKLSLEKHIVGHKIISFIKHRTSLRSNLDPNLAEKTINSVINNVRRVAKYLIIELNNNNSIVFHLGMTGRLTLKKESYDLQKHDHIVLVLESGNLLVFNDSRRFGMIYVSATNELESQKYLKNIGPEPFSECFNVKYLEDCFRNRKIPIKSAIMDNKIVVGIGNIYASESLFLSKINPSKPVQDLTKNEILILIQSIIFVLNEAIKAGGTTLKDFVNGDNKPGYFKQNLTVYDRKNANCYSCGATIVKIVQNGRATYFCPVCQKV